jgi:poly(3-hydroxybutyrate) depolymerase
LGLLVIAGPLAEGKLEGAVQDWIAEAAAQGVVVAVIGPRDEARWEMDEIEVLARVARQVARRWKIDPRRIATSGIGPGGSLAVVAAMMERETFRGVAIVEDTKLPRFRLRANDPAETLNIFWLGDDSQSTVAKGLRRAGYGVWTDPSLSVKEKQRQATPVLSTIEGGQALLRWNRFLGMF